MQMSQGSVAWGMLRELDKLGHKWDRFTRKPSDDLYEAAFQEGIGLCRGDVNKMLDTYKKILDKL